MQMLCDCCKTALHSLNITKMTWSKKEQGRKITNISGDFNPPNTHSRNHVSHFAIFLAWAHQKLHK